MTQLKNKLTLEEFLALPDGEIIYELIDGEAIPKFKDDKISAVAYCPLIIRDGQDAHPTIKG